MVKRILSVLLFLVILAAFVWLLSETFSSEVFPVGSELPELEYLSRDGRVLLKPDSSRVMLVMLFHPDCEHCEELLNRFNEQSDKLDRMNFVLLTTDQNFFVNNYNRNWPVLAQADNVIWGTVVRTHFIDLFGPFAYPSSYIFKPSGKLSHKISGIVKMEKLLGIMEDFGGGEG